MGTQWILIQRIEGSWIPKSLKERKQLKSKLGWHKSLYETKISKIYTTPNEIASHTLDRTTCDFRYT